MAPLPLVPGLLPPVHDLLPRVHPVPPAQAVEDQEGHEGSQGPDGGRASKRGRQAVRLSAMRWPNLVCVTAASKR
jgi:hypothetical protein